MTVYSWFNQQNNNINDNNYLNPTTSLELKDFSHCWPTATANNNSLNATPLTDNKPVSFNYPTMAKIN